MSRESRIQYNPALSVPENAKNNGVTEAAVRYYIKVNGVDRRHDSKINLIETCRKYLKKHPQATKTEVHKKTGHSLSTIRYYWQYISTEKELTNFDSNKRTKKRNLRQLNNFYASHPSVTQDILNFEVFNHKVLEPFCGTGIMAEVIKRNGYDVDAYDIIDRGYGKVCDFMQLEVEEGIFDIVSNPPYDDNLNFFINKCISLAKGKVALLLPLNYLAGEHRAESVYSINPPKTVYVYAGRIPVGKNGDFSNPMGNKVNYAWYVWEKGYKGEPVLKWLHNGGYVLGKDILLGTIAGDMIGKPYERRDRAIKTKDFPLFDKRSKYTDDTVLTIAVMDWLMIDREHTWKVLADRFVYYGTRYRIKGQDRCFSRDTAAWLLDDNREFGKKSMGNGAAMRVSPVGWWCNTIEEVEEVAAIQASLTHNTPEGIIGAQIAAAAVFLARTGKSKKEIQSFIEERYGLLLFPIDFYRESYEWTSLCMETVRAALVSFIYSENFEDAIRNAVSFGGDADTIGAITGSIAEAYYGEVPEAIKREVLRRSIPDEFKMVLTNFSKAVGR